MTTATNPLDACGVARALTSHSDDFATVTLAQQLSNGVADHRGRIELGSYAVLVDTVGGMPFVAHIEPGFGVVQSRLSFATAGHPPAPDAAIVATATLRDRLADFGCTTVEVSTADRLVAAVQVRSVRTGRMFDPELLRAAGIALEPAATLAAPQGAARTRDGAHAVELPPAIDPVLDGVSIIDAIAAQRMSIGPFAQLLGCSLTRAEQQLTMRCTPQQWMSNALGTMHGGVIAALAAQAVSFAGQLATAPGGDYRVSDLTIDFFRSPALDAGDVVVVTDPVRVGRRVATMAATMTTEDGTPLAQTSASVRFE
ncbi:PaaI family thioesterase [Williamsia sp. CHRR-6]|uniref:PaaI family thioesterase n=1 Tax=Williamsia sp. CHRR-6 TaxID=2835871 RepID=UPI001BDAD996|nr:PaaI family thioesterase [Williamsia sp. CHRR-6]MBT0565812.1 PaaI family thioesterase [Williamsia sp. CHRR-6]